MKPKVAFFDFASCEGCQLQVINLEEEILELVSVVEVVSFREAMKEHSDDYDIAFIEGSIQRPIDEERLKKVRANAKILVAMGACAHLGGVQKLGNQWTPVELKREVYKDFDSQGNSGGPVLPDFRAAPQKHPAASQPGSSDRSCYWSGGHQSAFA